MKNIAQQIHDVKHEATAEAIREVMGIREEIISSKPSIRTIDAKVQSMLKARTDVQLRDDALNAAALQANLRLMVREGRKYDSLEDLQDANMAVCWIAEELVSRWGTEEAEAFMDVVYECSEMAARAATSLLGELSAEAVKSYTR